MHLTFSRAGITHIFPELSAIIADGGYFSFLFRYPEVGLVIALGKKRAVGRLKQKSDLAHTYKHM